MLFNQQFLFTPGPTPIPDRVKLAMNEPMIAHRSKAFSHLLEDVSTRLQPIFGARNPVLLVAGTGTSTLETAACNVVEDGDHVVVVVTGAFGDRFANICQAFGANVHRLNIEWGKACEPGQLEEFLKSLDVRVKAIFATYCETSTGVLNPIKELGRITKQHTDALFIVDGVSCIGAVPVAMEEWKIDILVSGSQKALMLPPGLAFIALNENAREVINNCKTKRFYFDVNRYLTSYYEETSTPFTPAVSLIAGAREVCSLIEEEGWENVIARHQLLKEMLRRGLEEIEIPLFVEDDIASPTVTSIQPKEELIGTIKQGLQEKFGIIIAGGQKHLKGKILRIGHMGYCTPYDVLKVLTGIEMIQSNVLDRNIYGKAIAKAEEVWGKNV
ncbi:pyridoxal-phosphate-dependent aminotransferase family protein [Heyndrickxia camelliae]|uniref:Aminotransferase n=1 Tax=Heyndrickxia camelliae TaxID=1707093 RepID=A0A2N3LIP1_9BACI|nr:alanine--glyoxylate aminotransferase family protein [Heyndrickxia camelliae]PKR84492.1 aminotransferase [Heyndrickxia camelliae]